MNHKEQRATELKEKRPQSGYCGFYNRIIKRIIDFILSLVAAVAVTPIVFIIGIFIAIEDGFPVFYTRALQQINNFCSTNLFHLTYSF